MYSDGNEWALYRNGELQHMAAVRLSGDVASDGKNAIADGDADALEVLLREFFLWEPIILTDRNGKIDLKDFAAMLAPYDGCSETRLQMRSKIHSRLSCD
ncbi:MAG: hypothetical protein JOZ29_13420 [Deltaproteobacteria bacterium]|nr:hypothetical protein [Deltaproteobacteria bacterium]